MGEVLAPPPWLIGPGHIGLNGSGANLGGLGEARVVVGVWYGATSLESFHSVKPRCNVVKPVKASRCKLQSLGSRNTLHGRLPSFCHPRRVWASSANLSTTPRMQLQKSGRKRPPPPKLMMGSNLVCLRCFWADGGATLSAVHGPFPPQNRKRG